MKKDKHPKYQEVLFVDSSTGDRFVCGSALQPEETETFNGKEYPVSHVSVSSYSHPFFSGEDKFLDTEGRIRKFERRYGKKGKKEEKADA